ncbi:hypothetical protein ACO0K3_03770 [Undibacterium sp. Rencai35W]|uniref:hypothetical protein n=1 Tax=Undibacterium sp. Rencai35W TaxID=3413046 RepID=UPI003BF0431F
MDAVQWIVLQCTKGTTGTKPPERFNPRPEGVIVQGSASDVVLAYLRTDFHFKTRSQIIQDLQISEHRVEWGLIYLMRRKLIKRVEDSARNSRYGRYRALREGE